jgi:hypothetical protein
MPPSNVACGRVLFGRYCLLLNASTIGLPPFGKISVPVSAAHLVGAGLIYQVDGFLPVSEAASQRIVSLSLYPYLTDKQID